MESRAAGNCTAGCRRAWHGYPPVGPGHLVASPTLQAAAGLGARESSSQDAIAKSSLTLVNSPLPQDTGISCLTWAEPTQHWMEAINIQENLPNVFGI